MLNLVDFTCGMKNYVNETALIMLFKSKYINNVNFDSKAFHILFNKEYAIVSEFGNTILMTIC